MYVIESIFAYPLAFFGLVTLVLGLVAIILAPFVIDKADNFFGFLNPEGEILFKSYPLSFSRMGRYGFIIIMYNFELTRHKFFSIFRGKARTIEDSPKWLRNLLAWVYGGFGFCAALTVFFGLGFLLVDSL